MQIEFTIRPDSPVPYSYQAEQRSVSGTSLPWQQFVSAACRSALSIALLPNPQQVSPTALQARRPTRFASHYGSTYTLYSRCKDIPCCNMQFIIPPSSQPLSSGFSWCQVINFTMGPKRLRDVWFIMQCAFCNSHRKAIRAKGHGVQSSFLTLLLPFPNLPLFCWILGEV